MGHHHADGYSATVEGYFVVEERRYQLAKTNGQFFVLAETCELPAGTEGEIVISVDGVEHTRLVVLPVGAEKGKSAIPYEVAAPF